MWRRRAIRAAAALLSAGLLAALLVPAARAAFRDKVMELGGERDLQSVVSKVAGAYGGRAALETVKALYAKGRIVSPGRGGEGDYACYFKREGRLRVDILYRRGSEHGILNGRRAYRWSGGGVPVEAAGTARAAMLYDYRVFGLPWALLSGPSGGACRITRQGSATVEGSEVEALGLACPEGPPMRAYVDGGGLVIKAAGYPTPGSGTLYTFFSDFRDAGGSTLPFRMVNMEGGRRVSEVVISRYRINPVMGEELFEP
jgi:hypothetical protein